MPGHPAENLQDIFRAKEIGNSSPLSLHQALCNPNFSDTKETNIGNPKLQSKKPR